MSEHSGTPKTPEYALKKPEHGLKPAHLPKNSEHLSETVGKVQNLKISKSKVKEDAK